jgi:excinuclease ABC subunit C
MSEDIRSELLARSRALPAEPGVYLLKDAAGAILYVGKAADLRGRVSQYFGESPDERPQLRFLLPKVADLEVIVTASEKEALLLEHSLVQLHRPRYNISLKDDKRYSLLRLSLKDEFPRLTLVRRVEDDGARYFGPYPWGGEIKDIVRYLYRIFPLRNCPDPFFRSRKRPCIRHSIGLCNGACVGLVSREENRRLAEELCLFLAGQSSWVIERLRREMAEASQAREYEKAAAARDRIAAIERALQRQAMVNARRSDLDAWGLARDRARLAVCLLRSRRGRVIGQEKFLFAHKAGVDSDLLSAFLLQYYAAGEEIPDEILLPAAAPVALAEALADRRGKGVALLAPERGEKRTLIELAGRNAAEALLQDLRREGKIFGALEEIQARLRLPRLPRKIECYDVSNLGERAAVGARVAFVDGKKEANLYRHYSFGEAAGIDDFGLLARMIERRIGHLEDDPLGDLLLVDGGKGQLSAVGRALAGLAGEKPPLAAIAKERSRRGLVDRFFLPGRKNPLFLRPGSKALRLLAAIRDEAHRFAISYHRQLFGRQALASELGEIPGIGPKRERSLLSLFGDLRGIAAASLDELQTRGRLPRALAERVRDHLQRKP